MRVRLPLWAIRSLGGGDGVRAAIASGEPNFSEVGEVSEDVLADLGEGEFRHILGRVVSETGVLLWGWGGVGVEVDLNSYGRRRAREIEAWAVRSGRGLEEAVRAIAMRGQGYRLWSSDIPRRNREAIVVCRSLMRVRGGNEDERDFLISIQLSLMGIAYDW